MKERTVRKKNEAFWAGEIVGGTLSLPAHARRAMDGLMD
jgi:hypothetical protein